jgi:formate hydrogenlyase subunit 6/NADH:ubiquinone oxidoreductase subunit I
MIFKVFDKKELSALFDILSAYTIIGPVQRGVNRDDRPLFDFDMVYDFGDLALDYTATTHSAKRFFMPYTETLSTFQVNRSDWDKRVDFNTYKPQVFFGMHACDVNALNKLDKVLTQTVFPNPYYLCKRKNMFIIGMGCTPQPQCFCRSMGTDTALQGFDLFLTDLGNRYFAEILSAPAFQFLSRIKIKAPTRRDQLLYEKVVETRNTRFNTELDTTDLAKILDLEFESKAWKEWGGKCLSCGSCAQVCPTCYCYGVEENVDLDLKGASKVRHLHSCNLLDFAEVAGGHNFRPDSATRLKYRYYHKHRGFMEAFEESLCVGCGRCGKSCLAGITPPAVISSVRHQE